MLVARIGKGKMVHHVSCGMVIAAPYNNKTVVMVEYDKDQTTCRQCFKKIKAELNPVKTNIDVRPVFRLTVLGPFQYDGFSWSKLDQLLSEKAKTHVIRIGVPTKNKAHEFLLTMDAYASDRGFTCVEVKAGKRLPTEQNEWMINCSDAVVIYNDGHWITKRAIKHCVDTNKRVVVLEVA